MITATRPTRQEYESPPSRKEYEVGMGKAVPTPKEPAIGIGLGPMVDKPNDTRTMRERLGYGKPEVHPVFTAIRELVAPTTPYTEKEAIQAYKEIPRTLENAGMRLLTLGGLAGPLMGLKPSELRAALDEDIRDSAGFGGALVPALSGTALLAIEWGYLYPKLFKAVGAAPHLIARVPGVTKGVKALKSLGGIEKVATKYPRLYNNVSKGLGAFTKGYTVGTIVSAPEALGEELPAGEVLKHTNKSAVILGGVALAFQGLSQLDTARYIKQLRSALIKASNQRFAAKIGEIKATIPKGLRQATAFKSLGSLKRIEMQNIDGIVSASEAQLIGLKSGKMYQQGQGMVETPQKAAERFIAKGYLSARPYPGGEPSLKKGLGKTEPFIKMPTTKVGEAKETIVEAMKVVRHPVKAARAVMPPTVKAPTVPKAVTPPPTGAIPAPSKPVAPITKPEAVITPISKLKERAIERINEHGYKLNQEIQVDEKTRGKIVGARSTGAEIAILDETGKTLGYAADVSWAKLDKLNKPKAVEVTKPEAVEEKAVTPAMKQYAVFKEKYPETVILMKMGDFYEAFGEDAKVLNKVLGTTMTKRGDTPIAGVPYHAIDSSLKKIIQAGHKVAVVEEVAKDTKGEIKRDVVRVTDEGIIAQPPTEVKAEEVKPKDKGFVDVMPLLKVHKTFMNIVEPSKVVERKLGKEPYAAVIKGVHQTDVGRIEFNEAQIERQDKSLSQMSQWFNKFSDKDLKNFMASRGEPTTEIARIIQKESIGKLPKELRKDELFNTVQKIADSNYKYLQSVVGDDINRVEDYFYGIYKNPKEVDKFLDYWRTTKRFTKEKKLPTVADALDYGLELRNYNPIENLKAEYIAISHLEGMNWMKDELLRTGKGKFIDSVKDAPLEWDKVQDPVFNDLRLQPDLAKLINNLISTNKITQIPLLNTLRNINNVSRTIKFIGSAFHLLSVAKQSVADSGYLGFLYKPTALRGFTRGFKANDPIFRTTAYKDYIRHGGGHRYSVESEARRAFTGAVNELNRNMGTAIKVGVLPLKIPTGFVNWMFQNYIPKVKYAKFLDVVAEQEKKLNRKLTSPEKINIIKEQQNFYGMMNERLFGRSGTVTSAMRFYFMSPGYAEGNYRSMLKALLQWGGKGGANANRSRSNIINSWLITGMAATVGTLIFTGKLSKKPEDLESARDLFKIDTGKKDEKGRQIMIDLMTYDKDYWNVAFNLLRLRPDVALGKSWKRIGGMKAPTAEMIVDLALMSMGRAIYDWKGDRVVEITDPFLLKAMKLTAFEIKKLSPISVSVFQQSKKRGIDTTIAAIETLLGFRPGKTEKDIREQKITSKMYSLAGQREEMSYYIGQSTDPKTTVEQYNKTVNNILNSPYVPKPMKDEWSKKLLVDYENVVTWKRFPAGKMTDAELSRAYDAHTLSVPYKRRGEPFRMIGEPKKGSERRVGELKAEAEKRGIELKRGPRKPPRR